MTRTIFLIAAATALLALMAGCGQQQETSGTKETSSEVHTTSARIVDPVCGMEVDPETAMSTEYQGKTYYFCSADCHQRFMENPAQYVPKAYIIDPVCGMVIGPEASFKAEYGGKTYYFCSAECHEKFMQAPEKYMTPEGLPRQGESHPGHGH